MMKKYISMFAVLCLSMALSACGGGGGGGGSGSTATGNTPASNSTGGNTASSNNTGGNTATSNGPTASTVANQVPLTAAGQTFNTINRAYVSVTVCVPGTNTCQTIPNVVVDTGSTGLRLFASAMTSQMLTGLQEETSNGQPVNECAMFAGGNTWGTVRTADVKMAGEVAASTPIQVISDGVTATPSACMSSTGSAGLVTSPSAMGGNGLIGVDSLKQDCGAYCSSGPTTYYYAGTTEAAIPISEQVTNPVSLFSYDNNGILLTLPSISSSGAVSTTGTLTFGIDTQSDNTLSSLGLTQYETSGNSLAAKYGASATSMSAVFDSGSALLYFADSSIPLCGGSGFTANMYCPSSALSETASVSGTNGTTGALNFTVENANTLISGSPQSYIFNDMAETTATNSALSGLLDMGLPFFYGRSVGFVLNGGTTYEGTGPAIVF